MSKITLPTVASGYNLSVINSNFQAIEDTLNDSVLFRDEDVSNEMSTNLDMNGFSIYNVNEIDSDAVTVGGVPLAEHIASLAATFDPNDLTIARYVKTITIASSIITLPEAYGGTASSLMVFRNGVQQPSSHYTFDGSNITFSTSLSVGEVVDVVYFKSIVSAIGAAEISDVSGLTEALAAKQAALVSGVNIRTVNGNNILGGGDLSVGVGTVTSVAATVPTGLTVTGSPITSSGTLAIGLDTGYSIPTTAKQSEWDAKQAELVSGTNIKTINGSSVLGSGNLVVAGTGDVVGPASSTDNTLPRFDGTTGKLLQGSGVVVDDSGNVFVPAHVRQTAGSDAGTGFCRWSDGTTGYESAYAQTWRTGPNNSRVDRMTLDVNGNLGVGTASPPHRMSVRAGNDGGIALMRPSSDTIDHLLISTTEAGGDAYSVKYHTANNNQIFSTAKSGGTGGNITFRTAASGPPLDSFRVNEDGGVLALRAGIGYGAGAGGTVTQATSKTTSVTLNKPSGKITMNNAALGASSSVLFTFLNSFIGSTDMLDLQLDASGITDTSNYQLWASAGSGAAVVVLRNISGGSLSESVGIRFAVKKVSQT